jgi:3'-phosphoadenosine 5'-phosphosulfate sulfotransferase (PAPS reductase)/FAD synthetase
MDLGQWSVFRGCGPFSASKSDHSFAGISGGATSGMMAALLPPYVRLCFENTGREHPNTYEFLRELATALGREITWLEFRKPQVKGARPRDFDFAVVDYATADRSGGPFEAFMEAIAEYRETKGEPPLSPWARQRICSAYMKHKVLDHYVRSLGIESHWRFIGLRADEVQRVFGLRPQNNTGCVFRTPLYGAAITKQDVREFWSRQSFRLEIREEQGNCTGCFLKDQSDIARVLMEPESDAAWWVRMDEKYPDFGGRGFAGYKQLAGEGATRVSIEAALRSAPTLVDAKVPALASALAHLRPDHIDDARFRLVVIQERNRLRDGIARPPCACEAALDSGDEEALLSAAGAA